jgi:hypothetical protein
MGLQGGAGIQEVTAEHVPHLPSPYGLATPERAAPDRVNEIAFMILVHEFNMRSDRRDYQPYRGKSFLCPPFGAVHGGGTLNRRQVRRDITSPSF